MDWSYIDETTPPPIDRFDELLQLQDIANKVGSYRWNYKPEFQASEGVDGEDHIGPTAQQIASIPGLESAVFTDEQGNLKVDTSYLSLATFGLLAALARIVIGSNNGTINNSNPNEYPETNTEQLSGQLSGQLQNQEKTSAETSAETESDTENPNIGEQFPIEQPAYQ